MIFLPFLGAGDIRLITSVLVHDEEIEVPIPVADKCDLRRIHDGAHVDWLGFEFKLNTER